MKILITGATGFFGSHITRACLRKGYEVFAYRRKASSFWRLSDFVSDISWFDAEDELEKPFKKTKINHVIHTASCYGRNNETVPTIIEANVLFPLKIAELAFDFNVDTFFNTDTILYEYLNYYALSKKQCADLLMMLSRTKNNVTKFINMKVEHLYGPYDDESKFVTQIIRKCLRNVDEIKLTKGEQKRDFIFVDDAVNAYMTVLRKHNELSKNHINIPVGSGSPISIKELVEEISVLTKTKAKLLFGAIPCRKHEIMNSSADISILKSFGWAKKFNLKKGLEKTFFTEKLQGCL